MPRKKIVNPRIEGQSLPPEISRGQMINRKNEDKILRTMPITQSQLKQIKRQLGIK